MKKQIISRVIKLALLVCVFAACRTEESPSPARVSSIRFVVEKLVMNIGEETSVKLVIEPAEAKGNETVTYKVSEENKIDISSSSNDGCVIKAVAGGSVVLIAQAGSATAYLEVSVSGAPVVDTPYIVVPTQVIEVNEGARKSVQVSLYGGTVLDNAAFEWRLEEGKDNITIESSTNTVVVDGVKRGSQKIFIHHPSSDYDAEILVFVIGVDEEPKYITTLKNVLVVEKGGQNEQFSVNLVNGRPTDKSGFLFEVVEGTQCISVLSSNETCNVTAVESGTAVIRITHPLAEYALDVRIIVVLGEIPHIEIDKTFIILNKQETSIVTAEIAGNVSYSYMSGFSYELSREGIIHVIKTNNQFFIEAKQSGSAVLTISNTETEYSREVLVVVRGETLVAPDDYYITTSQNVIQMEVGQSPLALNMLLVGGVEADKNSFAWNVDDSRIIEVESVHGNVTFERRARAAGEIENIFNAIAMITPKKTGTAKITISHPKSSATGNVMVKVYPRGTFATMPILVGTEGLLKIVKGTTEDITLSVLSGDANNVGELLWTIDHTAYATVTAGKGLNNQIAGISSGTTKLHITGDNLKNPHESILLVGTAAEIDSYNIIYVDNIYQTVYSGQSVFVEVKDSRAVLSGSMKYRVNSNDSNVIYATMVKSRLLLQGINPGTATVMITNDDAENTITMNVTVEPETVSIDQPYTINAPNFIGLVKGSVEMFQVSMAGASETELGRIGWRSDNTGIVSLVGNSNQAQLTAVNNGQTKITVSHSKSSNEKTIIAYVVNDVNELNNRVLLGLEKENYLLTAGDELALRLITNANDTQKSQINWAVDDISVLSLDQNGDVGFIRAVGAGTTKVTVTHPQNVIPLVIYISVSDALPGEKSIAVPSIIELLVGENKVVTAETLGLSGAEITAIRWSIDDESVASISNDGNKTYILGKSKGQAFVTCKLDSIGYSKKILLVCADTYEELENTYVMNSPETYYKINIGDIKNISLQFGSAGFPEAEKQNITWAAENNNVVRLVGNGDKGTFEGINAGIAKITVSSGIAFKAIEITVEVNAKEVAGESYAFSYTAMYGLVIGDTATVQVMINPAGAGYGLIEYENQDNAVVTVSQTGDGNEFFITAVGAGQTYLNLRHPKVVEPARILFYTAATQEALDNMFPISLAKTNYLVGIGETVRIKIDTPSDDAAKLNQVRWSLDNNGIVSYDVISKKEIEITGVTPGNCVFSISYNNEVVEKAYISVKSNTVLDGSKKIITESIVGMVKGQSKATAIVSNLNPTEIAALEWSSDSVSKVTVTPVAGDNVKATLTAVNTGETYVTVKLGDIKRRILVYVCDTQAQVDAYKAMNIDTQYYQLKRQEELTLSVFYAAAKPSVNAVWEDVYNNNVVEITAIGNKAQVKGINEGIATIKITNAQCVTPIYITVEVSNAFGGTVEENEELWYLSASKTIYVLNPDYPLETVSLQVNPVGFSEGELTNIKWEKKEGASLVQLYPAGASCTVAPGSGEGTAVLRVTHAKSSNYLEIRIIVTREPLIEEGMPYIAVAEEVIRVAMNGEAQVRMNLLDAASPDVSKFAATSNNGNVTVSVTGDMLTARGISYGQSLVTITHPDAQYPKKVVVIVTVTDDGILYLTTENNFSLIQRDDYKALEVALIGFEETNNNRFHWTADTAADGELVSINASGNKAVVTGKKVGTAKIKVTHDFCQYPLYVYARVTELGEVTPTYITTSNNIVSVKKGNSMQVLANLINGMEAEYSLFTWSTNNRDIIELNFSGNSALIRGLKSGTAGVTIAHPSSLNSITILVVVEEDTADSGIYIATDSQLVELKPTDASRHISVRLVGGSAEDIYGFQWQIVDYVSIVKNKDGTSRPVVTLVANADNAYVMPTSNEGEATIRVTHPKTSYRLDLKVMVQLTTQIVFEKTNLTMDMLTSQSVSLESPTGITVIYESSNDTVASVMGTDKVCIIEGHKAGTVVITARNASGTTSDEIVVKVNAVDTSHTEYISTSTNLLTLNTNMAPVTVSAKLVAATAPDTALLDTQYLVYTSDNTDVVSIYGSGSSVSVTPKGAGTAEITIKYINGNDPNFTTYPSLKNYVKRIYVKVEVDEMIFSISDTLLLMVEGEKATVTVKVDNVSDINYNNDISWVSSDSTVASVGKISSTTSGMAQIVALKEGTAVITATYKGSIRNCTVQVTKPKMFTISATSLDIAPGQTIPNEFDTVPIRLTLLPSTDKFTYSMDNYNCVDMQVSSDTDGATVTLTGRNVEGLTVITFTATSGLRCSLTVNNVRNYNLQWKNRSNLREDPYVDNNPLQEGRVEMYQGRRWYVMEYDIRPVTDTLSLVTPGGNFAEVAIDSTNKKVYIRPLTPGYQVLRFKGDVNQFQIELPIYFFYENIEPKWIFSRRENHDNKGEVTLHSWVDLVQNAIYLADGERVTVQPDMADLNLRYPNHGLFIQGIGGVNVIEAISAENPAIVNSKSMLARATSNDTDQYVQFQWDSTGMQGYLQEQVFSVNYWGFVKIHYTYFSGGTTKSMFTKSYIVYCEAWRRK